MGPAVAAGQAVSTPWQVLLQTPPVHSGVPAGQMWPHPATVVPQLLLSVLRFAQ